MPQPSPLKRRRTKIVATLGPATSRPEAIAELIASGVDVFRLNMSHGSAETHRELAERVRQAAREASEMVAILVDLCGPKIRVGKFVGGGIDLAQGSSVTVTTRDQLGAGAVIPSRFAELP